MDRYELAKELAKEFVELGASKSILYMTAEDGVPVQKDQCVRITIEYTPIVEIMEGE